MNSIIQYLSGCNCMEPGSVKVHIYCTYIATCINAKSNGLASFSSRDGLTLLGQTKSEMIKKVVVGCF